MTTIRFITQRPNGDIQILKEEEVLPKGERLDIYMLMVRTQCLISEFGSRNVELIQVTITDPLKSKVKKEPKP